MTDADIRIGNRIKNIREQLEMSQEELAHKIGYKSKSSINKIELGIQGLTQSKIKAIADALQTTPSEIMGWNTDQEEPKQDENRICDLFDGCTEADLFETVSMLLKLDANDRAEIRGEIRQMLKGEKYSVKKESKNA